VASSKVFSMVKSIPDFYKEKGKLEANMESNPSDVLYWKLTEWALEEAKSGMDNRAKIEEERILSGENVEIVHTQALRDFEYIKQLIIGGVNFLRLKKIEFQGIAADLGSGTGMGATILSKLPEIEKVFAIEYSEQFVLRIMPEVFIRFDADREKIVRVVGDFNSLEIENNSLSLILDVDSFHHSEDLNITLKECNRVLKPSGVIISVDRAWPDKYTRKELDEKLNVEFNDHVKKLYGIPEGQKFTRGDFGEHEYTIKEWVKHYQQNNFQVDVFSQIHPPALNSIFIKIPAFEFSIKLAAVLSKLGFAKHLIYGFNPTRKLFVAQKK